MSDEKTVVTEEDRDKLVNERFTAFVQELAQEIGESPMGAVVTVCWAQEDRVSVAVSLGRAPAVLQMKVIDLLARKFVQAVSHIKAKINTQKS